MVVVIRLTDPPFAEAPALVGGKAPAEKGYKVTLDGQRAVFHDVNRDPPPGIVEQPRLTEKHRGDVYVTPCGGIIEAFSGAEAAQGKNEAVLMGLLGSIQENVAERHNVTIINRSTQSSAGSSAEFFHTLVLSTLGAVGNAAERAIQIVADEVAKERQMQRLLQSDDEVAGAQPVVPKPPVAARSAGDMSSSMKTALGLSPQVQLKLRTMSAQREKSLRHSPQRSSSARNRFTLLAASSENELLPPSSDALCGLTPKAFIAHPPDSSRSAASARRTTVDQNATNLKAAGRRQSVQAKKRATLSAQERLSAADDPSSVQPIRGNGWGTELRYLSFNGSNSVLALPPIPRFEEFVKSFTIDFWLKTDCKMADGKRSLFHVMEGQRSDVGMNFQIGLNFHSDFDEHIRVYIRDAGNRVMEVLAPLPMGFTSGHTFHHVLVRIKNLETGKVEVLIDGEPNDRLRYTQQEHPISFNPWPHSRVYIGSYVDDMSNVQQCIRGGISELRLWRGSATVPFQRWPLAERNVAGKLVEATHSVPDDHQETLTEVRESISQPPKVSPLFDGSVILNMGTLGAFGELLTTFTIETRFKTTVTGRSMSLVGVTDAQEKMMELGIVLNAEPVLSRERYRYHEHHITLFLVDAWGACCSALVRGTERQHVMDGQWHTIQWKMIDSESNKLEVRIDNIVQDILQVYREGPSNFCALRDYVCVGGHNVRNWKVRNAFSGQIMSLSVDVHGECVASLAMDEGPGATVCQDSSGRHNHALIVNPDGGQTRRHDLQWLPCNDAGPAQKDGGADGISSPIASTIIIHKNNFVSIAAVRFGGVFDSSGTIQESVVDLFTQRSVEVVESDQAVSGSERSQWRSWRILPNEAFHGVETAVQLKEMVATALKLHDRSGHLVIVLRIGDCCVSLVDLIGPLVPPHSVYDCNMLKWKYAIAINGTKGKKEQLLNNCVVGLERMLIDVSANPSLTSRVGPANELNAGAKPNELVRNLTSMGIPWRLALVAHSLLLNYEYASHLHMIFNCPRLTSEEEAASVAVVSRAIQKAAEARAALLIQRNFRGKLARTRVKDLEHQRKLRKQQVEEIMALRRANPLVQPKKNLRAIIITAHEFATEALPSITSFNINDIIDPLRKQGYAVEHIKNPSRSAVSKAIGSIEPDSCTFVYISGYGGNVRVRQPPITSQYRLQLSLEEGSTRAGIELEAVLEFKGIAKDFFVSIQEVMTIEAQKAAKKGGKKATNKNAAAQAQQQRHVEETFRVAKEELFKEETENRTLRLQKEYETEVAQIQKEIRVVISAAQDFEDSYRSKDSAAPFSFFFPCDCRSVEPFGMEVFNVDDLIFRALQRQLPPMGFQAVVAIDIVPLTPGASGLGVLAASTGHTLTFPYQQEQRHVLSWTLRKALQGYMPRIAMKNKEAILLGAVDTPDTQRDWRSFATYVASKMIDACNLTNSKSIQQELAREMSYTADLVPVRTVVATAEAKERVRRDLETKRSQASVVFAVDSLKVTSDMNGEFKSFLQSVTINETINLSTILLSFLSHNQGIDSLRMDAMAAEVDRCAPANAGDIKYQLSMTSQGVHISFNIQQQGNADKQKIQQWINCIAARSISWRIPTMPFAVKRDLEVERIELLFAVKTAANNHKIKGLMKQRMLRPLPYPTIRFFNVTVD